MEDIVHDTPQYFGDAEGDLKSLTLGIGVSHKQWKVGWWRSCFEIRYRYGNYSAVELLGKPWGNRLQVAVEQGLNEFDNGPILRELDSAPERPKCLRFLATELAREFARAAHNSPALEVEPWEQPVKNLTLWNYLRRSRSWYFDGPGLFKYIEVEDGTQEALIGRILYFLQAAEDWHYSQSEEPPPELMSVSGLPRKGDSSKLIPNDDFAAIATRYENQLSKVAPALVSIVRVWLNLAISEQWRAETPQFNRIRIASGLLERFHPGIHAEHREWVERLRREFVHPYVHHHDLLDEAHWQARLALFRGALEDNPLLNWVLGASLNDPDQKTVWRKHTHGRPAEISRGKTCAFAVQRLRMVIQKQSPVPVNKLFKDLSLSPFVTASLPTRTRYSVYAVAAPLLAALFQSPITPEQVKANSSRYKKALMDDRWLRKYTAELV